MRARAFEDWANSEAGKKFGLEITIHQTLEGTHPIYNIGVETYNWIQRLFPRAHHLYWNFLEQVKLLGAAKRIFGKRNFIETLELYQPHILISTHPHLNHGFFEIAKQQLGRDKVTCITYCGELFGSYGFSRQWVNPDSDLFIGAVDETCEAANALGMAPDKSWVGGFLLKPKFYDAPMTEEEKREFIVEELEMDPDKFILVLGTGANGANNHLDKLEFIYSQGIRPQVVALCARNNLIYDSINLWDRRHPSMKVKPLRYTDKMAQLLQCASAVVARPGTGLTSEAIYLGCPIISNGIGGLMPQEIITVRYCRKHNIGRAIKRAGELPVIIKEWMDKPEVLKEIRANLLRIRPKMRPLDVIGKVVDRAKEINDS
ncbi:MAG: UDP-N-acetylglucosamine--LPS N-acetylglucosamine transferase [Opitutales bacterium]|nr:UDP-N-acetylglucosamine--LPS N-acetylglucosamine transferase [Opitutales bacterium]